jgi:hypothetical protein
MNAFWDGRRRMIWYSNSYNMEEPNGDKKERAMGFQIDNIVVLSFS